MKKLGLFLVLIIALFSFTSCNNNNDEPKTPEAQFVSIMTNINDNLKDCTNVVYDSSIMDGSVLVKGINKNVNIVKNSDGSLSLTVTTTNQNLSSDFVLEEQVLTDYIDGQMPETLFAYNFSYASFSEITMTETSITGVIRSADVSTALNTTVNNNSDLAVTINYAEGKITDFAFSYTTTNGNSVTINATYSY